MALALTTITDSISKLTVPITFNGSSVNLTIKDIDEIPEAHDGRAPVLYPEPAEFVTNFKPELASLGRGTATTAWNVEYSLKYTLLYAPINSGRGMEMFAPTVAAAFAVIDKILTTNITGAVKIDFESISTPGPIADPSGVSFFGVQMTFRVLEYVN